MFTGIYEHTIDKKGRTSMPARFRNELGGEAYISVGIDRNLVIYSTEHFNAMANEIGKLSLADPTARIYRRRMFNKAEAIEIDANGRFMIPSFLREELSSEVLDKVVFGANAKKFAIIVTDKEEEITVAIDTEVERGSTLLQAEGGHTGSPKAVVMCACSNKQLYQVRALVRRIDPEAFMIMMDSNEVAGEGFRRL